MIPSLQSTTSSKMSTAQHLIIAFKIVTISWQMTVNVEWEDHLLLGLHACNVSDAALCGPVYYDKILCFSACSMPGRNGQSDGSGGVVP